MFNLASSVATIRDLQEEAANALSRNDVAYVRGGTVLNIVDSNPIKSDQQVQHESAKIFTSDQEEALKSEEVVSSDQREAEEKVTNDDTKSHYLGDDETDSNISEEDQEDNKSILSVIPANVREERDDDDDDNDDVATGPTFLGKN